ncbi:MAG TPA: TolC family protein, partial [Chthonomonadales bacterium]|nr:TolC family protein [Chthonomonadales bacterium]
MEHTIRSGTFIRLLAVFLGLSQSMGRAQAQTPSRSAKAITPDSRPLPMVSGKISLPDAVQFALRHSPVVRGSEEELRAAEARVRSARARQLPWVSLNGFLSGGSNSNIVSSPEGSSPPMIMGLARGYFADGNVSLMAPVYTGGRLEAMIRAAAADEKASRFDLEVQRQDVILMTRTAYRQAQARNELISVAQARLTDNQERLRDDKLKLAQGAIPLLT